MVLVGRVVGCRSVGGAWLRWRAPQGMLHGELKQAGSEKWCIARVI